MKEAVTPPAPAAAPPDKVPQTTPRSRANHSSNLNVTFAAIPAASSGDGDDSARALGRLAADLARQLGIRTDQIRVRMDREAGMIVTSRDAQGVAQNGVVYLRSEVFDPTSRTGRRLLAHEAAHIAQTLLPEAAQEPAGRTRGAAEIEAEVFAETFAAARVGKPVRVPLAPSVAAADKDFNLLGSVAQSRIQEIGKIIDLLSYGVFDWAVTDTDVFDVLQILSMYPVMTARAMATAIDEKYRGRLFSNLNPPHYAKYRTEILAVCWAATSEKEFASENYQILNFLALNDLDPLEAAAVDYVVTLSPKVKEATAADEKRAARIADAQALAQSEKGKDAVKKGLEEARTEEQAKAVQDEDAEKARDKNLDDLVTRIRERLREGGISDKDALGLLDSVADQCLGYSNPADRFLALANGLTSKTLDEFIGKIPAKGLYETERRRKSWVYMVATRPPFKNEQIAEDLMTSPWWKFWDTVTSEEAFLAYLLVKSMPARARTAFLKARGGEKWGAIVAELPQNIRESASFNFYQGGAEQKDRQALLTELLDNAIWTAAAKDRLDATIRMARAAGEAQFVFEQSKVHRADKVEGLGGLVEKYQLYLEGTRESYTEVALKGKAWYDEGILGRLQGAYHFLALVFGVKNVHVFGGRMAADINLDSLHDYGGIPTTGDSLSPAISGARFHKPDSAEKQQAKETEKKGDVAQNFLRVEKRGRGELNIDAPKLLIDQLSLIGDTTVTASPVMVAGLHCSVKYIPETMKPLSLEAGFDDLTLSDCAIVRGDAIYSVNSLKLTNVRLRLSNESLDKTDKQDGLGAMFSALLDPKNAMGLRLSFDLLQMRGVATSGGMFVESVEVDHVTLQAGGNADAYLDALNGSLTRLNKRIEEEEQAAKDDSANAAEHQTAKAWIEKQRDLALAEIKKGPPQGSVVDIRSIRVQGIPGLIDEPLNLSDVHGQGQSVAAVAPLFSDPTTIRNMIRGSEAAPTMRGKLPGEDEFKIGIRQIKTDKPIRITGDIPSAAKAKEEFDDFVKENGANRFADGYQPVYDALKQRAADAKEYEDLAGKGVQNLGKTKGATDRFRALRASLMAFEERRATIIEKLSVEGVSVNISGDGNPELIAETLSAKGISTFTPDGREGLHIGEVSGQGVSVGATLEGGLGNAKEWRKNLQSASLKARQLTLKDIRHAGSGAAIEELTFQGGDDANGLEATFNRNQGSQAGASVGIRSRRVIAKGVSIPAHRALLAAEQKRLEAIPDTDRRPEEKKRLAVISDMLADLDKIEENKKDAEAAAASTKSKSEKAAAQKKIARSEQDLKNWQDRLVVEKLTIEDLDISIGGLGDVLDKDYNFGKNATGVTVEGKGKQGHWFEKASVEGVRSRSAKGDQVLAEKIEAGPTGGKLIKTPKGFALEGFSVESLTVRGVAYASGDMNVQAVGETTLSGIAVDAEMENAEDESKITITRLRIERIKAENLKYEDADKTVTVVSGELLGLQLSDMHVTLPEDPKKKKTVEGKVTLDSIKSLTLNAVAGGYKVNASLNAAKPQGAEAHALSVELAKSGDMRVALKGLSASADVAQRGTSNKVHVEWKNLGGTVEKNGDTYKVTNLAIGNLTLSQMQWKVGQKTINIDDKVTLTGISLDAEAALQAKKKGPGSKPAKDAAAGTKDKDEEPEKEISRLVITKLVVDEIQAKQVRIQIPAVEEDKAKGVEFSPMKAFNLEEAVVRGLTVTGFDVLNMQGKVEVKKSVSVTNLRTTIGDVAKENFKVATTSFKIFGKDADEPGQGGRELSATLTAKDGTIIRLGRTDSLTLSDIVARQKGDAKGGKGKEVTETSVDKVSLAGITTGDLIIKDDFVSIDDILIEGPVGIAGVSWKVVGASTQTVTADAATLPDMIRIGSVRADFKQVPTGKIVAGKEQTRSELDTLTVTGVSIPKASALNLHYHGPLESKGGVKTADIHMPQAMIEGIEVHSLSKDFSKNLLSLDAGLKSASAPHFVATLTETIGKTVATKKFGADITSGEIRAKAVYKTTNAGTPSESSEMTEGAFELDSVGLHNFTGTLSETGAKDKTIGANIDVKNIRKDKAGTTVGSATVKGVTYRDPNIGLQLDIDELAVPQTTTIPAKGPVTIPKATITKAHFHVDDILGIKGSGDKAGGGGGKPVDSEQFYRILDHVNGNFKADVYVPIYIAKVGRDLRQDVFNVDIPITDGKFNYQDAWSKAVWLRNRALASLDMDSDDTTTVETEDGPVEVKDMSKSYLTLEAFSYNIIEWHPGSDAERKQMTAGSVDLKRIIRPTDTDTEEDKKKKVEKKKKGDRDAIDANQIELRDVAANISLKGYIPLDLGDLGRIGLGTKGGDALTDLALRSQTTSRLQWSLNKMALTVEQLNFGDTKVSGDKPGGAVIQIDGIENGSITFTNGKVMQPKELEGTVKSASVKNLAVDLGN